MLRQLPCYRYRVLNLDFLLLQNQNRLQLAHHALLHALLRILRVRLLRLKPINTPLLEPVFSEQRNLPTPTHFRQQLLDQQQFVLHPQIRFLARVNLSPFLLIFCQFPHLSH